MRGINSKETTPPRIWNLVWDKLEEVSDENGEDELGEGYLLKYEGWGGVCVEEVWVRVEEKQKRQGKGVYSEEAEEEREEACYEYAEEQSYKIIDRGWKPELRKRGYCFIEGGYDAGGLYGRTWVLFKKETR